MGSMREVGPDAYELRVYTHTSAKGTRLQRSRRFHGSERQAKKALSSFEAEIEQQKLAKPAKGTLGDLLERWLTHSAPSLEPTTLLGYRSIVDRVVADIGDTPLAKLTSAQLDAYYVKLATEPRAKGKPPLSPARVQRIHAAIRRALNLAVRWGELPFNPASEKRVEPPRVHKTEIHPPSDELAEALIRAAFADDGIQGALVYLAAATGARRGELCALRWGRVDLDEATLTYATSIADVRGVPTEKATKTHQSRTVNLGPVPLAFLRQFRTAMDARAEQHGTTVTGDSFVFSWHPGGKEPLHPDYLTKWWGRVRKTVPGGEAVRLHDLRHLVAVQMLADGIPVSVVSRQLGHARQTTTLDFYSHAESGAQKAAAATHSARLPILELE